MATFHCIQQARAIAMRERRIRHTAQRIAETPGRWICAAALASFTIWGLIFTFWRALS